MSARAECRKCGKAKKRSKMSRRYGGFCAKCVKGQRSAVKAQRAALVKSGIVVINKVARSSMSGKAAAPAPRRTAGAVRPLSWDEAIAHDPAARERARAVREQALASRGQLGISDARMIVKASGARTVREAWLRESDPAMREVLRRALYSDRGWSA